MPGKKPAKLGSDAKQKPNPLIGKKVLYVGIGNGTAMICPQCSRSQRKGMVSEYQGSLYCSELCVKKVANAQL